MKGRKHTIAKARGRRRKRTKDRRRPRPWSDPPGFDDLPARQRQQLEHFHSRDYFDPWKWRRDMYGCE